MQRRGHALFACIVRRYPKTSPLLAEEDETRAKLGPYSRVFVFVVFTQVVQALMSYDGGATQFCTSSLARSGWSPFLLGLLGAMDKFGQVATAFVWGEVLMNYEAKSLLVMGLFWKAACCLLFGRLQLQRVEPLMQLYMLSAKLGMGVTEALVSVWATVWVQRNAPQDARARWLGFAGTSAGIGSGLGSGVASLWSPVGAFVLQATLLLAIWVVMLLTPAQMFRFGTGPHSSSGSDLEDSDSPQAVLNSFDAGTMLVRRVSYGMVVPSPESSPGGVVTIESVRFPGHYLDTSVDPQDNGWKVRLSQGDPAEAWAQFRKRSVNGHGTVVSLESIRLPDHFLDARDCETSCIPQSRSKVRILEEDPSSSSTHFRLHKVLEDVISLESVRLPGQYLHTGDNRLLGSGASRMKVCMGKSDAAHPNWAHFRMHEAYCPSTAEDPSCTPTHRGDRSGGVWQRLVICLQHRLWLWTAMAISLCCFVTSGISFLWQNTVSSVWGFDNVWSFGLFMFSTGAGGFVGVVVGPNVFDRHLGGFQSDLGKAQCLLWCKRMMLVAALCSTICTLLLAEKAFHLIESNTEAAVIWQLAVLVACVFVIFVLINSITGLLYGINTDAVTPEMRTFAAGLTVSFQNVFGFAFGPLLPSTVAELVGRLPPLEWPGVNWNQRVVDGAKFAVGMGSALVATWALFTFTRWAALTARLLHISSRRNLDVREEN